MDTLGWIDDAVVTETLQYLSQVGLVFFAGRTCSKDVINIGIAEMEAA